MRNLLIDADIPAYQIAAKSEDTFDFDGDGELAVALHPDKIAQLVEEEIAKYCKATDADRVYVCLSAPDGAYFRKELEPTYKLSRGTTRKPELLQAVKNYLASEYTYYVRPRLEADDIMGILATHPKLLPGENIMCSADKDMLTVPGLVYNPNKPKLGIREISPLQADRFLMWQTIVGDATDGYPGCPGAGEKSNWADAVLQAEADELWEIVLMAYDWFDLTEEDAIHQARLARILRACDYNFKTKKVRLWNPSKIL